MDMHVAKQCIVYGSWLAWPVAALLLCQLRRPRRRRWALLLLAPVLVFSWARFGEPRLVQVRETTLSGTGLDTDIALVADIHLGLYKDSAYLDRVVDSINAMPVDVVAIAGDFTYEADPATLEALFAPLSRLRAPVYAVLGNHDQWPPGQDLEVPLRRALAANDVQVIEDRLVQHAGHRWAGLGDRWAGKDDPAVLRAAPATVPTLVLAHNPDSATGLAGGEAALVLAGHTHGGQIRIPWLYRKVIPTDFGFNRGEQWIDGVDGRVRVFTTTGTGEIGLPMRLFNPPTIDLLHLRH